MNIRAQSEILDEFGKTLIERVNDLTIEEVHSLLEHKRRHPTVDRIDALILQGNHQEAISLVVAFSVEMTIAAMLRAIDESHLHCVYISTDLRKALDLSCQSDASLMGQFMSTHPSSWRPQWSRFWGPESGE